MNWPVIITSLTFAGVLFSVWCALGPKSVDCTYYSTRHNGNLHQELGQHGLLLHDIQCPPGLQCSCHSVCRDKCTDVRIMIDVQ